MKRLLLLALILGAVLTGCSDDDYGDYEEYEYEGNEVIEVEDDDRPQRTIIIEEDDDEEWDDD